MPVPKPRPNEPKNDFVSRCISSMKKTDPERPDKQIQAICFDAWRSKESVHSDFVKILRDFINIFGEEEGHRKYDEMVRAYNIDASLAYRDQAQMKECWGGLCESYNWAKPLIQYLKEDEDAKYYKVRALTATISMNKNDYTNITELERSARTIGYRPLNLNHDPLKELPFPNSRVVSGEFEDKSVECIIRIANEGYVPNTNYSLKDVQRMLDDGDIVNPSIEAEPEGGRMAQDGRKIPEWWNYTALALLEKGVTLPGVPTTFGFEPLFLNESLGRSLVESLRVETHEREEKNMSEPEHLPNIEEPKTKLVEGQGIQNMDVCGQCKFFSDLVNTKETAPAVTGAFPTSAEVTISSGAVGSGVGVCSVDGEYKQKQDPACTDGRPREQATNLDRVGGVEKMIAKSEINDLNEKILQVTEEKNREIDGHVETQGKLAEAHAKLSRKENELAVVNTKNTRLSKENIELTEKLDKVKADNDRYQVQNGGLEKDVVFYKGESTRLAKIDEHLRKVIDEQKDELTRTMTKMNDESTRRAEAVQRALNAENGRARAVKETALLTEQVSELTSEINDVMQLRAAKAKQALKDQQVIRELREETETQKNIIRSLKKDIEKLKKRDFDFEISL